MNAAGHSAAAPNESDFSIKDHLYLKMATRREYKSVGRQFRRQQSGGWGGWGGGHRSVAKQKKKIYNLHNLKKYTPVIQRVSEVSQIHQQSERQQALKESLKTGSVEPAVYMKAFINGTLNVKWNYNHFHR